MSRLLPRLPKRSRSARAISRPSVAIAGGLPLDPESAAPASASECSAMNPRPRNEPSEWPRKMIGAPGCSAAIKRLKVQRSPTTLSHPPFVGEMAEIGRGRFRPVAAKIVGVDAVAGGVERRGETRIAGAVLGEAMGDLHDRPRASLRQPATRKEGLAVVGAKRELAFRHSRPSRRSRSPSARFLTKKSGADPQAASSARATGKFSSPNRSRSVRREVPWRGISSSPAAWSPHLARVSLPRRSARCLQARGYNVRLRKLDPYLNVDPGTMCPYQHGEVFVTDDGAETDLDLGHYERFTGRPRQPAGQHHHRPHLPGHPRQGAARRLSRRHGAGHPARHQRDQGLHPRGQRRLRLRAGARSAARSATSRACRSSRRSASSATTCRAAMSSIST